MYRVVVVMLVGCAHTAPQPPAIGHTDDEPEEEVPASSRPTGACLARPPGYTHWLDATMDRTALHVCIASVPDASDYEHHVEKCTNVEMNATAAKHVRVKQPPLALGPRAIVASRAAQTTFSDDGRLMTIDHQGGGGDTVWDVANDRQIKLVPPDEVGTNNYGMYYFMERTIVGSWTPCAGPCTTSRVFRRDGKVIVDDADGSVAFLSLGPHRLATFDQTISIWDVDTAQLRRRIEWLPADFDRDYSGSPDGGTTSDPLLELSTGDIVAAAFGKMTIEIVVANPENGAIRRRHHVPVCAEP